MLHILIDSRHPRINFIGQQSLGTVIYMPCPLIHTLSRSLCSRDAVIATVSQEIRVPFYGVFDAARDVAEHLVGSHHHQKIGEAVCEEAEEGTWAVEPLVGELLVVDALKIDCCEGAGDLIRIF